MFLNSLIISTLLVTSFSGLAKVQLVPKFMMEPETSDLFYEEEDIKEKEKANWFNLDPIHDGVEGVSAEILHSKIEVPFRRQDIVVAVIDSGVDIRHPDLQGKIWVNKAEANGQPGVDDDGNGYIDDFHGWNYLGHKSGINIHHENLELARQVRRFELVKAKRELTPTEKRIYGNYVGQLNEQIIDAKSKLAYYRSIRHKNGIRHFQNKLKYHLNPRYNPRPKVIGDNPLKLDDIGYGNNNVQGPDASHGTHVAGIIAANRDNRIGMKGVASRVKIMSLRAVPDGDEYDKDIANAIRYAADNGARIINMSFGKSISPFQVHIDKAIAYAHSKGVLLFHAAGNDGKSNDNPMTPSYPTKFARKGGVHPNYIQVGASRSLKNIRKVYDEEGNYVERIGLAAGFSNFGPRNVDLFAPGVNIYSTIPPTRNDKGKIIYYDSYNGTSMATPVAAGVAALILSVHPNLSPVALKNILKASVVNYSRILTVLPGSTTGRNPSGKNIHFGALSQTGGIINALKAADLASR